MTPKISLVTVVAAALVAVPAAWGGQPPDAFERAVASQQRSTPIISPDAFARAVASQQDFWNYNQTGEMAQANSRGMLASDAVEAAREAGSQPVNLRDVLASDSVESARVAAPPFNLRDVLASDSVDSVLATEATSADSRLVGDNYREPPKPVSHPTTIAASDSGREIEWPQIGMGFGLGILLAIGLFLAMRHTRIRQLAH